MVIDELQKVIDEYNKIAQEKKDRQILLEASQIEVDLLEEELEEVKMQLNNIRKSPSHSSVRSNIIAFNRRRSPNQSSNISNSSISNSPYHSAETSVNFSYYTCGDIGHKSFNGRKFSSGKWIWRPKEQTKRTYKKGIWVIDSGCSRHMCGKKENFKTLNKIDGGYARIRDNAKGEVVGVGSITLSSLCDMSEVSLVEGLKHNLLNISQLCDVGFKFSLNATTCTIRHVTKDITIVGDRIDNIYVDLPTLTCLTAVSNESWLWRRKLRHTSMHAFEKLSKLELVIGLPKIKFEKDHICDAC
ncbi:uncharacterized protein LOC125830085 [Solanum verrucosum]|uniref:uncharacterized protein LOC125830085 n=1 Tax=Solanum verrucosum TaxID=315347 RepID=UPI0020D1ECD5|nr:uncharacterized protein LOC125830085 [Solanum verrucosum]